MKGYTLAEIAELTGSELVGDPHHLITGVDNLESATSQHASFFENVRYGFDLKASSAGVIIMAPAAPQTAGKNYLLNSQPSLAFQKVIELFMPKIKSGFSGIHPSSVIHPEAKIGANVSIGPHVTIDAKAIIGDHTQIDAGSRIGAEVKIGKECHLHSNVVIREGCILGDRVVIQPGAVIGSSGFGYFSDAKGNHHALEQLGTVILEDDVEIGANTTIDRARFKTTKVGKGTKIDNLVQIAHQVELGPNNLIISQVGIAGSTKTGRNVVMAGQVGVIGHIEIADNVILAARSAVSKAIPKAGIYSGAPAIPIKEFNEQVVLLRNIKKIVDRLKKLEDLLHSEKKA
jgi:UDP-3-O-[3-hydroxymyristoyl] glucosamine N-acyltransferase